MSSTESLNPWLRQAFVQLIANRAGLKIRENDQEIFQEIVFKRTKRVGLSFPENYYQFLESQTEESHEEWQQLIPEITNTESFFFRDKGQFKLLRNHILPNLIQCKAQDQTLRIGSAGCSTGEEPYSIAILLKELIPNLEAWNLTILGVDINSVAIAKAKAGIYRPWSFRGLDNNIKNQFFQEFNGQYHIDSDIKRMVKFQTVNLLRDSFSNLNFALENMDLILCRNVFIYFSESAIKTVLNKFYAALQPSGYLLVGHAELHGQNLNQFQVKVFEESIAYQRPTDDAVRPISSTSMMQATAPDSQKSATKIDPQNLGNLLAGNDIKMQQVALNLLRQLPADTKISRLGNLTAAELILQLEQSLK
ncbi:MAG: protein-glutamate O-methyltransferase CheR [Cyanothece sp. SIO1E1]|nr:protein-glutamate O-methyltransferase CheR [Cyanothece sp. SIO1E1]